MADNKLVSDFAHEWKHAYNDRYGNPHLSIKVVSYSQVADDLIEDFAAYLMACGFYQSSIINGFQAYIDEHKDAVSRADGLS